MSRRSKRQKKRAPLAADRTETNPFPWLLTGMENPAQRGVDERNSRQDLNANQIDTERHRDPVFFRAVDYYDKLPLGPGLNLESENDVVLQGAKRFWNANDLDAVQHQIAVELATTANIFVWIPRDAKPVGEDLMSYVPSLELIPTGQIQRIATRNGRPWYYRRQWEDREYQEPNFEIRSGKESLVGVPVWRQQDIAADEIVHVAINRSARELRGVSMLQPALYWSKLYARTLKMIYVHSVAKAWLALHIKVSGMNEGDAQLEKLKKKIEDSLILQADPSGEEYKALATGQAMITGENVETNVLSSKVGADSNDDEKRRLLLQAAVAAGLPEVLLSDGDTSNLAAAATQSNPFFRLMESHQATLIQVFEKIFRVVFDRYQASGWMNIPLTPPMTHVSEYLKITAPDILAPDMATLGPVVVQLTGAKVMSLQTGASKLGLNWEDEKRQIEEEKAAGLAPSAPTPGASPFPSLPFSFAPGGFQEETRTETDNLSDKMRKASQRAIGKFKKEMAALGQGSRDQARAMELYLALVKELKSILKKSIEKGQKVGEVEGAKEAEAAGLPEPEPEGAVA